jgi:hypothetical protein
VPRFSLSAIGFSPDESPRIKQAVLRQQYASGGTETLIPFQNEGIPYYDQVHRLTRGAVAPETRQVAALEAAEVFDGAHLKPAAEDLNRLNTALGLAGLADKSLIEEVARMEISMARHVLGLRRLVLRYMKALILFVVTTMVSFGIASVIDSYVLLLNEPSVQSVANLVVLSVGYLAWSVAVGVLIGKPIDWIWELSNKHTNRKDIEVDGTVTHFELLVRRVAWVTGVIAGGCVAGSMVLVRGVI